MSSLLNSVGIFISFFVDWLSSLTTALISNPVIQLVFAVGIIFTIINFVLCLLIDRSNKKPTKKYHSTRVITNGVEYDMITPLDEYQAGVDKYLSGYYD